MTRAVGLLGVLIVLCAGFFIYQRSVSSGAHRPSPLAQVDAVAIRQHLLTIAQAERQYQASNGKYATLAQLSAAKLLPGGTEQRGYTFAAIVTGTGFTVTATPTDRDKNGWPIFDIDERMKVAER
jgi:hypothetical protein